MYLSEDSIIYTTDGWTRIGDLEATEILLVACCDIIGRTFWTLTKIEVLIRTLADTNVTSRRRGREAQVDEVDAYAINTTTGTVVNGLINTTEGWKVPEPGIVGRWIDIIETDEDKVNSACKLRKDDPEYDSPIRVCSIKLPIGESQDLRNMASEVRVSNDPRSRTHSKEYRIMDVLGLPIGVIIDGMSIYPSNINKDRRNPISAASSFRRRTISPFVAISDWLKDEEQRLSPKTTSLIEPESPTISRRDEQTSYHYDEDADDYSE